MAVVKVAALNTSPGSAGAAPKRVKEALHLNPLWETSVCVQPAEFVCRSVAGDCRDRVNVSSICGNQKGRQGKSPPAFQSFRALPEIAITISSLALSIKDVSIWIVSGCAVAAWAASVWVFAVPSGSWLLH